MESKKNLQTSLWSVFYIATILLFSTVVWGNEANKTEQKDVPEITNELSLLEISQILSNLKSEIEETKNELRIIKESNVQTNKRLDLLQETLIRKADLSELLSNLVSELLITRRPDQAWLPRCHQYIECP